VARWLLIIIIDQIATRFRPMLNLEQDSIIVTDYRHYQRKIQRSWDETRPRLRNEAWRNSFRASGPAAFPRETICCPEQRRSKFPLKENRQPNGSLGNGQVISSRRRRLCFTFVPVNNSVSISGRLNYEETFLRSWLSGWRISWLPRQRNKAKNAGSATRIPLRRDHARPLRVFD